jgi:hypothetical protein
MSAMARANTQSCSSNCSRPRGAELEHRVALQLAGQQVGVPGPGQLQERHLDPPGQRRPQPVVLVLGHDRQAGVAGLDALREERDQQRVALGASAVQDAEVVVADQGETADGGHVEGAFGRLTTTHPDAPAVCAHPLCCVR